MFTFCDPRALDVYPDWEEVAAHQVTRSGRDVRWGSDPQMAALSTS